MTPTACPVIPNNFQAIISEGLYGIKREDAFEKICEFLKEHKEGYFLRDEESPFDCHLIESSIFKDLYLLRGPEKNVIFIPATRKMI